MPERISAVTRDRGEQVRSDREELRIIFLAILNHENRVRDLEGRPNVTAQQLRTALRNL